MMPKIIKTFMEDLQSEANKYQECKACNGLGWFGYLDSDMYPEDVEYCEYCNGSGKKITKPKENQ